MAYLQTSLTSHTFKVKRLYKAALRCVQSWHHERHEFRYEATLLRARFDASVDEPDFRVAKRLLLAGEEELVDRIHPQPLRFANSPGGIAYGREVVVPDFILDTWHPLERLQYPKYFALRDKRKQEYIENWETKYGKAELPSGH